MFNINDLSTNSKVMAVDEEQLKIISGIMKKYAIDLNRIKKQSDLVWEQCSIYLDDNVLENINSIKDINNKKYTSAIEELNTYANKIETIANIWKDTENEIRASSKKLETLFSDINKSMTDSLRSISNNMKNQ